MAQGDRSASSGQPGKMQLVSAQLRASVLDGMTQTSGLLWLAIAGFGILSVLGVVAVIVRISGGFADRAAWGYYAAIFAWLMAASQGAPLIAMVTHLTRAHWGRPLRRVAEMMAVVGLLNALWSIPLLIALPPTAGRNSVWFDWPWGVPGFFDGLAIFLLVLLGLALMYVGVVPDLAAARDQLGSRRSLYARLALGWQGTRRQWEMLQRGLVILGAFYLMLFVFTHFLISTDFSMSLVPGWGSSIYPIYTVVTAFQSAVALTIVVLALFRSLGGLRQRIGLDQFWGLAKILLALSLFWFYFFWSDLMTLWYGRKPNEIFILDLVIAGPYRGAFLLAALFMFVVPFGMLIWNKVRVSIWGPTLVSISILVGLFFDRLRLYVSAWSVAGTADYGQAVVTEMPATRYPDLVDVFIVLGAVSMAALLYLGATRLLPALSLWSVEEGRLLETTRAYLRAHVRVIGKPR